MRFGDMRFDMKDMRFGNSFTGKPLRPIQIMRLISNNIAQISKHVKSPTMLQRSNMGLYGVYAHMSYIRDIGVCQVSSVYRLKMAGVARDIPDIKHSIYKHYIGNMGIWGYKGLEDINV